MAFRDDYRRVFIISVLVILCLSLVLQTIGFVTPGWRVTEETTSVNGDLETRLGLWYITVCVDDNCDTYLLENYDDTNVSDTKFADYMLEYEIMTTIALFCCIVAVLAAVVWTQCWAQDPKVPIYVCITAAIVSGVLCLVSSIKMGSELRDDHDDVKHTPAGSPFLTPYSIILTGIGGILMIIAVVLAFLIQCLFFEYNKRNARRQTHVTKSIEPEFIPVEKIQPYNLQSEDYRNHMKVVPIARPLHYKHETMVVQPPRYTAMPTAALRYTQTPAMHAGSTMLSHNARESIPGDVLHVKYDPNRLGDSYVLSKR